MRKITQIVGLLAVLWSGPAVAQGVDAAAALRERVLGRADAPVTMVEYASLTCPHCASFHNEALGALKQQYIDTGKVKLVYRDFPLDGLALRAAMLARCSTADRYFGLVGLLFRTQEAWARAVDPMAALGQVGRLAGIDEQQFAACMSNEALIDGIIAMRQTGTQQGVRSTPTFFINGQLVAGSLSIEEFAAIIDPLLDAN